MTKWTLVHVHFFVLNISWRQNGCWAPYTFTMTKWAMVFPTLFHFECFTKMAHVHLLVLDVSRWYLYTLGRWYVPRNLVLDVLDVWTLNTWMFWYAFSFWRFWYAPLYDTIHFLVLDVLDVPQNGRRYLYTLVIKMVPYARYKTTHILRYEPKEPFAWCFSSRLYWQIFILLCVLHFAFVEKREGGRFIFWKGVFVPLG